MDVVQKVAVYGKGGSGKSTVSSNLSVQFSNMGRKTLQVGCDPKHDSTLSLTDGDQIPTIVSLIESKGLGNLKKDDFLFNGISGVDCVEAGGPEPGVGCAGRGIVAAFELIKKQNLFAQYDMIVLDVLGDVVCGGFGAPLMHGFADRVIMLVSDSLMSIYAANNISKAVKRFERNGAYLAGLVANNIKNEDFVPRLHDFAEKINTRILGVIPNDRLIQKSEFDYMPVSALEPESDSSREFKKIAEKLVNLERSDCPTPTPMSDEERMEFINNLKNLL